MTKEEYIERINSLNRIKEQVEAEINIVKDTYKEFVDFKYKEDTSFINPSDKATHNNMESIFINWRYINEEGNKYYCCDYCYYDINSDDMRSYDSDDFSEEALEKIINTYNMIIEE